MRKATCKVLAVFMSLMMILSSVAISASAEFDSTWTAITNASELAAIQNDLSGKYYLAKDITLSGSWTPIGWTDDDDLEFNGVLNGNGHTISNLTMNYSDGGNIGLFAIIGDYGVVGNLNVNAGNISGYCGIGAIAGVNYGTIYNCNVKSSGTFTATAATGDAGTGIGGITGTNCGYIERCKVNVYNIVGVQITTRIINVMSAVRHLQSVLTRTTITSVIFAARSSAIVQIRTMTVSVIHVVRIFPVPVQ